MARSDLTVSAPRWQMGSGLQAGIDLGGEGGACADVKAGGELHPLAGPKRQGSRRDHCERGPRPKHRPRLANQSRAHRAVRKLQLEGRLTARRAQCGVDRPRPHLRNELHRQGNVVVEVLGVAAELGPVRDGEGRRALALRIRRHLHHHEERFRRSEGHSRVRIAVGEGDRLYAADQREVDDRLDQRVRALLKRPGALVPVDP